MATTSPPEASSGDRQPTPPSRPVAAPPARKNWLQPAIVGLVVVGGLVAGGFGAAKMIGNAGGDTTGGMSTYEVVKRDLQVTVTEDGNLESASNVDIKCRVEGTTTILTIVQDGATVDEGDTLVELDSATLEEQISSQQIAVNKARASMVQAQTNFEVAKISLQEYIEGTFRMELQNSDAQITIEEENLRTAQNTLDHSQRMFRKGYVSKLQLESQEFAVKTAELNLAAAKTSKEVLEKYTKAKMVEDLEAKIESSETAASSEEEAYKLEEAKLERLKAQLEYCVIKAPQAGMVVYANDVGRSRFGGGQGVTIEEGATVRERQSILKLPDLDQMQVKVNVHESKVEDLRAGMRARIAIQDREFFGEVESIATQPEATSWWSGNVKEYGTIVKIDGSPTNLKPGMTAEVEIQIADLEDVIAVPVATVVEIRGGYYCWVKEGGEVKKVPLVLGLTNDSYVEIKDGVKEGDQIVMNPRTYVEEARNAAAEEGGEEKAREFGKSKSAGAEASADRGADKAGKGGPAAGESGRGGRGAAGRGGAGGGPGAASGGRGGAGGSGRGGRGGGGGRMDLMSYDKDGDGKVTKEEAPAQFSSFFDRLDTDGDGGITKAEIDALRARYGSGGGGGGGAPQQQ